MNLVNRFDNIAKQNTLKDYSKLKLGDKYVTDVSVETSVDKIQPQYADKSFILKAIKDRDYKTLRDVSRFYYETNGIYARLCRYMAYLYRYDWMVVPYVNDENIGAKKVQVAFNKTLCFLDRFGVKDTLGDIALQVLVEGCYYCYVVPNSDGTVNLQELPPQYCRSRFTHNRKPVIEFDVRYFDAAFKNTDARIAILSIFPKEFAQAYVKYKEGTLEPIVAGEASGWFVLNIDNAFKFNINQKDFPLFSSIIPSLIDLDKAQEIDRKKMLQNLVKVVVQEMPLDKNGDPIFDQDEITEMHKNAVSMLGGALGLNVLTTFADTKCLDTSDTTTTTTTDELEKVERTVYNNAGIAKGLFNSDTNSALTNSILTDESSIVTLVYQFERFLNHLVQQFNIGQRVVMSVQLLHTTAYNYKEMAEQYKAQTQLGFSKFLPAIALGESQSCVLASAYFETDVLDINSVLIPPLSTNTMNGQDLLALQEQRKQGRPAKPDSERSSKTIANRESAGEEG